VQSDFLLETAWSVWFVWSAYFALFVRKLINILGVLVCAGIRRGQRPQNPRAVDDGGNWRFAEKVKMFKWHMRKAWGQLMPIASGEKQDSPEKQLAFSTFMNDITCSVTAHVI
jgi:hypothetical protein